MFVIHRLERRLLLAGNVTATVVNGTLIVQGDTADNEITLTTQTNGDSLELFGDDNAIHADDSTTINGNSAPYIATGLTGDVWIRLYDGADSLIVENATLPQGLRISTAGGDDTVLINDVSMGGDLLVNGGGGKDVVNILEVNRSNNLHVSTGDGADVVLLDRSTITGQTLITTAAGRDSIYYGDCGFGSSPIISAGSGIDLITHNPIAKNYDFSEGKRGWEAGFADLNKSQKDTFNLQAGVQSLPADLDTSGTGYFMSGDNHSDDLFMYLKRSLGPADGIIPFQKYELVFQIMYATNTPGDNGGTTGATFLKAGASDVEPESILASDGYLRMNVDKGNQANGGQAATVVAIVGNNLASERYRSVTKAQIHATAQADANGVLWLMIGTDSGSEFTTSVFYQDIKVTLIPIAANS